MNYAHHWGSLMKQVEKSVCLSSKFGSLPKFVLELFFSYLSVAILHKSKFYSLILHVTRLIHALQGQCGV